MRILFVLFVAALASGCAGYQSKPEPPEFYPGKNVIFSKDYPVDRIYLINGLEFSHRLSVEGLEGYVLTTGPGESYEIIYSDKTYNPKSYEKQKGPVSYRYGSHDVYIEYDTGLYSKMASLNYDTPAAPHKCGISVVANVLDRELWTWNGVIYVESYPCKDIDGFGASDKERLLNKISGFIRP